MNQDNYCSLEVAQRLIDAGIVLEADAVWVKWYFDGSILSDRNPHEWRLQYRALTQTDFESIPAPCFTDVWRELPEGAECKKQAEETKCVVVTQDNIKVMFSPSPTDALIDLLVWLKGEGK